MRAPLHTALVLAVPGLTMHDLQPRPMLLDRINNLSIFVSCRMQAVGPRTEKNKLKFSATPAAGVLFRDCRKQNLVKWSCVCMMNLNSPSGCDCISIRSACLLCQALGDRMGLTTKPFRALNFYNPLWPLWPEWLYPSSSLCLTEWASLSCSPSRPVV